MPKLEQVDVSPQEAHQYLNTAPMTQGAEGLERAGRMVTEYSRIEQGELTSLGSYAERAENEYNKHVTFEQVSNGSASWANLQNQKTEEWNDGLKGGQAEDPKWVDDFNKKWSANEQNWSAGFSTDAGKEFALRRLDESESHWGEKQMADKSTLDKERIYQNFNSQLILSSNRAYNDPTAAVHAINDLAATSHTLAVSSNMSGSEAAEFETKADAEINKIAQAAGYSMADKNPQAWLDRQGIPKEVSARLSGENYNVLDNRAREALRQNGEQDRLAHTEAKRQSQENFDGAVAQSQAANVAYGADGRVTVNPQAWSDLKKLQDQVAASKGLIDDGKLRAYDEFLTKKATETGKPVTDPTVKSDLMHNVADPDAQIKILTANAEGKLDDHDTRILDGISKAIQERYKANPYDRQAVNGSVQAAEAQLLGPAAGNPGDPAYTAGKAASARWEADFYPKLVQGLAAGKPIQDLLSGKPGSLTDPADIQKYAITGDDLLKATVAPPAPPAGAPPKERPPLSSFFGGGRLGTAPVPPPASTPAVPVAPGA